MVLKETSRPDQINAIPTINDVDKRFSEFINNNPLLQRFAPIIKPEFDSLNRGRKNLVMDLLDKTAKTINWNYYNVYNLINFTKAESASVRLNTTDLGKAFPSFDPFVEFITALQRSDLRALMSSLKKSDGIRGFDVRITFKYDDSFEYLNISREIKSIK